jgi:RING-box protein 1
MSSQIKILEIKTFASWKYKSDADNCGICRYDLCNNCIHCEGEGSCPVVRGVCGHIFHEHCIGKWVAHKNKCPIDAKVWENEKMGE